MDPEALCSLKYSELQQYAKNLGIKANLKADKLRAAIIATHQAKDNKSPEKQQTVLSIGKPTKSDTVAANENIVACEDMNTDDHVSVVNEHLNTVETADQKNLSSVALEESSFCNISSHSEIQDAEVTINMKRLSATRRSTYDLEDAQDTNTSNPPQNDRKNTSKKLSNSSRKPINWSAIHQRQFEKMDSLDVFLEKRQQRHRFLRTPPKRAAALNATISVPQANPKPAQSSAKKAKTTVFVPTVFSTANISTNFTAMFGNAAKTPGTLSQQAKENRLANTPGANKSIFSPSVVSAKKPVFDLKASLARPLNYTPHYGKLKPLAEKRVDVKTATKANHREQRRQEMKTARDANRRAALTARRQ